MRQKPPSAMEPSVASIAALVQRQSDRPNGRSDPLSGELYPVDTNLQATLPRLHKADLPSPSFRLRAMQSEDLADVERIAGWLSQFGRYCTDPFFPGSLAVAVTVRWVQNAFCGA